MASLTTSSGQILYTEPPKMYIPSAQKVEGGILNASANKTVMSQLKAGEIAKSLGAGQKGSSRRRRRKGGNLNVAPVNIPTANSITGVSATNVHIKGVDLLNQVRADKMYDGLVNATPRQVAGFRFRDEGEVYGSSRRRKAKNGRHSKRTHRRKHRKSSHRHRRRH